MPVLRSIRARLTVTFLAVILAVMVMISLFLYNLLERYYLNHLQESLTRTGHSAAEFVAGYLRARMDPVQLSGLAEIFNRQARARVVFIDRDGTVVGDSARIGTLLGEKLARDEVAAAFQGEVGTSVQYSEKSQQKVMQVAVPVVENGQLVGAVFLSASLQDIYRTLQDIQRFLLLATLIAMVIAGGGSIILAWSFTGPIELLTAAAAEIAEGKLDQQIEVRSVDEIGGLANQFNIMATRLHSMTRNLKNFAADVSHELRTPLASLSLLVKSLQEYSMEAEQRREFLEDMDRELDRLILLVNDLLELTRLEQPQGRRSKRFSLSALVQEVVEQLGPRFERQGMRLIATKPAGPVETGGSALQIRRVLHNLLDNAIKYTSPGGWVRISTEIIDRSARVKIEDTGCGIPPDDLPHLFERFYRVDPARSREAGGTGLGLAIAREIVETHGGRIWAESSPGKGSTFYFTLPTQG